MRNSETAHTGISENKSKINIWGHQGKFQKKIIIKLHINDCIDINLVNNWEKSSKRDISRDGIVLCVDYGSNYTNICM